MQKRCPSSQGGVVQFDWTPFHQHRVRMGGASEPTLSKLEQRNAAPVPYKFGLGSVLSGPWAPWGTSVANGATLAAKYSENKIELDLQDDRSEPRVALSNLRHFQAVDRRSIHIFAGMESVEAVAPVAHTSGQIILSLGGMTKELLRRNPNVVNVYALADNEVMYLVPYWTKVEHFERLAIIRGNWTYGEAFGTSLESAAVAAGMKVTMHEAIDAKVSDFRAVYVRLLATKPDVVFIHQAPEELGIAIRQLRELGYKGAVYSGFYAEYTETITSAGKSIDGVRYTTYSDPHGDETAYAQFAKRFKERFGSEPNYESSVGYDGIQLLDRVLTICKGADPVCVLSELRKTGEYRGVSGKVTINSDGSAVRPFGVKEFKNGTTTWLAQHIEIS